MRFRPGRSRRFRALVGAKAQHPALNLTPVARFVPSCIENLRSASTMLYTEGFHSRPVKLNRLGDGLYIVVEVSMSPAGDPVWCRMLPVERSPAPSKWVYHKNGRQHFIRTLHEPVYLYHAFDTNALSAAIGDAQNEGYEL